LERLLQFDPSKRITAAEALSHPYFNTAVTASPSPYGVPTTGTMPPPTFNYPNPHVPQQQQQIQQQQAAAVFAQNQMHMQPNMYPPQQNPAQFQAMAHAMAQGQVAQVQAQAQAQVQAAPGTYPYQPTFHAGR
jgi:negative regulator of the PHO system